MTPDDSNLEITKERGVVRSVVLIVAMQQEAMPFIERHSLVECAPSPFQPGSPMVAYTGTIECMSGGAIRIHLIWNGRCKIHNVNHVATTAAGVSTYAAISSFHPDLVISAGTAGGFGELGAHVGDVYLSTKCIFHGRRIPISLKERSHQRYLEEYGFGHFRCPPMSRLAKITGLKQGVVSSSDSLDSSEIDLEILLSEGAVVKEMEAAAVAWVCQQLAVPCVAIKSITDIVDGPHKSEDEFYHNLSIASDALQEKLTVLIRQIGNTTLSQWANNPPSRSGVVQEVDTVESTWSSSIEKEYDCFQPTNSRDEFNSKLNKQDLTQHYVLSKDFVHGTTLGILVGVLGICFFSRIAFSNVRSAC